MSYRKRIKKEDMQLAINSSTKICYGCGIEKDKSFFHKRKASFDGLGRLCIECKKKCDAEYREKNQDKFLEYDRNRQYDPNRILQTRATRKRYEDENLKNISFKIGKTLRSRLIGFLNSNKNIKSGSFVRDLGCNLEELKLYIESKFYPHPITQKLMTWEDWGIGKNKWQIDHTMPLFDFNLEDRQQFLQIAHYTNLQPLWTEDHCPKTLGERNARRKKC